MPESDFGVPGKRRLPIHDKIHVGLAWDMVSRTKDLTPEERDAARSRIKRRAHELGVDTTDWSAEAEASIDLHFVVSAMSIEMPEVEDHPNRAPFKGVLTRVDEPSDEPPGGATGKKVLIPAAVAEAAIPSLLGMAIDCDPSGDFDKHDPQFKIGIITGAQVVGNALEISGFFYANDFPELWQDIQREKHSLGFSYEVKVRIHDRNADIWVVDGCVFTGAALLYKSKAAYHTTSLAAKAEKDDAMTPEELKALNDSIAKIGAAVTAVSTAVTAQADDIKKLKAAKPGVSFTGPIIDQVRPHVEACHAAAEAMEAAGIGSHPTMGHAAKIRQVGDHMMMAAASGRIPHIFNDHSYFGRDGMEAEAQKKVDDATAKVKADADKAKADGDAALKAAAEKNDALVTQLKAVSDQLAGMGTKVADLEAAAKKVDPGTGEPQRRTVQAGADFVSKYNLKPGEDGKVGVNEFDRVLEAGGISGKRAIEAKLKGRQAGVLS